MLKTLGVEDNFLGLEAEYSNYEDSEIVIMQAPYEHTVSYGGGTKSGPKEIIKASQFVEFYDEELDKELCFERKIATLEEISLAGKVDSAAVEAIYKAVKEQLANDKFVVTLGGEHTISTAPIKAHFEKYPKMSILQFDAHSDLRESYEGSIWSHASIMARVCEFFPGERVTQVGIRAQCKEEREFIHAKGVRTYFANELRRGLHTENWQKRVADSLGDEIYVTFDVDYFDPAIMPSTGTPEPDGFLYSETLDVFREIKKQGKKLIGIDVVELAPRKELSHPNILTASLVYKLLNYSFYNIEL